MNTDEIKATQTAAASLLGIVNNMDCECDSYNGYTCNIHEMRRNAEQCVSGIDALLAERERVRVECRNTCDQQERGKTLARKILAILDEKEPTTARGGGNFGKG